MTVAKFILPSSQVANDLSVLARIAAPFAPHAAEPLALAAVVDPGHVMVGSTLVETSTQIVQFALPASQSRIDRIVVNTTTAVASVIVGTEAANPSAPALPAGVIPIARVSLNPAGSLITNDMIVDERDFSRLSGSGGGVTTQQFTASGTYTPRPGTTSIIVEVIGGGGGGGGSAAAASGQGAAAGGGRRRCLCARKIDRRLFRHRRDGRRCWYRWSSRREQWFAGHRFLVWHLGVCAGWRWWLCRHSVFGASGGWWRRFD